MTHDTPRGLLRLVLYIGLALAAFVLAGWMAGPCLGDEFPLRRLLDALWQEEASGRLNPPDGDAGEIGPYQIRRCYWQDARMPDGTWQDCRKKPYAERVMCRYWKRYGAKTHEQRARQHNGGPRGHKKKATLGYWRRVERNMRRER